MSRAAPTWGRLDRCDGPCNPGLDSASRTGRYADNANVKAIAIRDGVIIATDDQSGRIRALAGAGTKQVNLNGRRVVPRLIDAHLHGIRMGSYFCFSRSPSLRPDLDAERSDRQRRAEGVPDPRRQVALPHAGSGPTPFEPSASR
jgi:predicted amidohydrolase YtcJ